MNQWNRRCNDEALEDPQNNGLCV